MCNALFDIRQKVKDETLRDLGLTKGTMSLIWLGRAETDYCPSTRIVSTGGRRRHLTMIALLGGGPPQAVATGTAPFTVTASRPRCQPNLGIASGTTGISLILVTPDAERDAPFLACPGAT